MEQSSDSPRIGPTTSGSSLTVKKVVTAFLSYRGRILLLRRSSQVGSYRGRWAGISGYIEHDEAPIERALKEISEEVGLGGSNISLVRMGQALPAFDKDIDTLFVVHPFLFLTEQPKISLDWEHDDFRWVRREDLRRFETVPKLKEALDRVLDDTSIIHTLHPTVLKELREISDDRVHGASELSRQSLGAMSLLAELAIATSSEDLLSKLRVLGRELMNSRPNMAPLTNLVGRLLYDVTAKTGPAMSIEEIRLTIVNTCKQLIGESGSAVSNTAAHASDLIQDGMTVFTHSRSATVSEVFRTAVEMGKEIRVIVTESRPLFEGRVAAQELSMMGIPVTLAVDSAVGDLMETANLCVVGADSVLWDGSVVNKIGTFPLAMSAREHGRPFYVVCEKSKFNLRSIFETGIEMEERDPSEVLPYPPPPRLTVRNPYFDRTPSKFISRLITEDGLLAPEEFHSVFRKMLAETYL